MAETIRFANGRRVGYDEAIDSEADVLHEYRQFSGVLAFKISLFEQTPALERLVALHIGVDAAQVKTGHTKIWRQGSFNVVVPMLVFDSADAATAAQNRTPGDDVPDSAPDSIRRVLLRCPLPAKCAETFHPGSILEKMRCETASYVWMQRHCPLVRIPHLYGFGLPNGMHFAHAGRMSLVRRAVLSIRQLFASWMGWPVASNYLPIAIQRDACPVSTGYMILEHFGASFGNELPVVARKQGILSDPAKMRNLFRDLSRIILAVARIPQPRIGAFRFNDDGTIALDNRPITRDMFLLENAGAPRAMGVDTTYTNVDQYVADLQAFHEQAFLMAPNAALDRSDCEHQMGIAAFLRTVSHHFIRAGNHGRNGPFVLYMSDQNAANIMVDDDWNVTGIFDLEWIISAPADMPRTPGWLTWGSIDQIAGEQYGSYDEARVAFAQVFAEEERLADTTALEIALGGVTLSSVMDESWTSKRFWFYSLLLSVDVITHVAQSQILPLFYGGEKLPYAVFAKLWSPTATDVMATKIKDRARQMSHVAALFGRDPPSASASKEDDKTTADHKEGAETKGTPITDGEVEASPRHQTIP